MKEGKVLTEMSLSELWELFPIDLRAYDPVWKIWAEDEEKILSELLAEFAPIISHIGSTAIEGIMSKPIVDLLVEISPGKDLNRIKRELERAGYICMRSCATRMSFNKGYTPKGYAERVFHIHIAATGDNDEVCFRDYLMAHPSSAREYEELKKRLLAEYRNDRDGYTAAKTDFVRRIMSRGKEV